MWPSLLLLCRGHLSASSQWVPKLHNVHQLHRSGKNGDTSMQHHSQCCVWKESCGTHKGWYWSNPWRQDNHHCWNNNTRNAQTTLHHFNWKSWWNRRMLKFQYRSGNRPGNVFSYSHSCLCGNISPLDISSRTFSIIQTWKVLLTNTIFLVRNTNQSNSMTECVIHLTTNWSNCKGLRVLLCDMSPETALGCLTSYRTWC